MPWRMYPMAILRAVVSALLICVVGKAWAHAPYFETRDMSEAAPFVIDWSLDKSIAIYARFGDAHDVDVVSFSVSPRDLYHRDSVYLHVSTLVPACRPYAGLLPTFAVVGPGQPGLSAPPPALKLPFTLRPGQGLHLVSNQHQGPVWYEPFGGKYYYKQRRADLDLYYPGDYRIYVWVPAAMTGDYVLEIGTRERFGPGDILRSLYLVPQIWLDREISEGCDADHKPVGD